MSRQGKRAFTLLELLIVLLIASVLMAAMTLLVTKLMQQTAVKEAERVVRFLQNVTWHANRKLKKFYIPINLSAGIEVYWKPVRSFKPDMFLEPSRGCKYISNSQLDYDPKFQTLETGTSFGGTMTIKGADGSIHYVILYKTGQIRADYVPPSSWE